MSIADLLLSEFDKEIAVTRSVIQAVPDDKGEFKPHEKSMALGHLAQLTAMVPSWTKQMMEETERDIAPKDGAKAMTYSMEKTATLLTELDKNAKEGRAAIAATSDADFDVPWTLKSGGKEMVTMSRYLMLRMMVLNHMVHHRAQLGVYLRLLGQKVPQMYGPTADDK